MPNISVSFSCIIKIHLNTYTQSENTHIRLTAAFVAMEWSLKQQGGQVVPYQQYCLVCTAGLAKPLSSLMDVLHIAQ